MDWLASSLFWIPTQSPPVSVTFALLIVLALLLSPWSVPTSAAHRAVAHLPRPAESLPLLGVTYHLAIKYSRTLHTWLYHECVRQEGNPFVLDILFSPPMVVLSSVEAMEDVFKTHFDKFVRGDKFTASAQDFFGHGIFSVDGTEWCHKRKTASHLYSARHMRDIMDPVVAAQTDQLCDHVARAARANKAIDIKRLLELYTTDVFAKVGFGADLDSMSNDNNEFFERVVRIMRRIFTREQQPTVLWKLLQRLGLPVETQHAKDVAWFDAFAYGVINKTLRRRHAAPPGESDEVKTLITLLMDNPLNERPELDSGYDLREIRDVLVGFLAAGLDTTAYTMAWSIIMVAQYPHVQHRIREELRAHTPELMNGTITSPSRKQIASLVYLEATIKETMRLNAIVGINTRETSQDVVLSDGTFLAAGTKVLTTSYAMGRLPSVWGDDATEFKPERWIDSETGELIVVSPFKFIAFHAGPRQCLGRQFAMAQIKVALAALLAQFQIETTHDPASFAYDATLALGVEGPVWIRPTFATQ